MFSRKRRKSPRAARRECCSFCKLLAQTLGNVTFPQRLRQMRVPGANCLDLVAIGGHQSSYGRAHAQRLGTSRGANMNSKLTKLAAAGVLSLCTTVSALAASVTQSGGSPRPLPKKCR